MSFFRGMNLARAIMLGSTSCNPLVTTDVIVTEDRDATKPRRAADASLTSKNGRNCTDHSGDGCRYEKSGAVRLGQNAAPRMFVSLIAQASRSCAAPNGGDRWKIADGDGFLAVNVRR